MQLSLIAISNLAFWVYPSVSGVEEILECAEKVWWGGGNSVTLANATPSCDFSQVGSNFDVTAFVLF